MFLFAAADTLQGAAGTASAVTVSVWGVNVTVSTGAEVFGLLYQGQLPASAGVLFTVPTGQAYIVKSINITNSTGSSVSGVQFFQGGSAAANSLIGPITMAGHYTLTGSENGWAMTDAAGSLQTSGGGGGGGTVTSVGLSLPAQFAVSGSPVTGSGTLTGAWVNESINTVFAGPNSGSPGTPSFRSLVAADIAGIPVAGALLNVQTITTTGAGTYTPTTGTNSVIIELVGGGGGSAGVASAASGQIVLGGSGGGGAYVRKRLTANFSGASYVVGAGGTAGASGNNAGSNGTNTTFTSTVPTAYTAGGGIGGIAGASFASPLAGVGVAGGTATNGDLNVAGGPSGYSQAGNTFSTLIGQGGSSQLGSGGATQFIANAASNAGIAGNLYGGGATGAGSTSSGGAKAGAAGGNGLIIIYEYS